MLLTLLPLVSVAQIDEAIEDWLQEDGSEAVAAEMSDLLRQYAADPVNVNDTLAMSDFPFITPFQLLALRNYITLHGQLLSLKELVFVPGFDSADIALMSIVAKAEPFYNDSRWLWWQGRHSLVTGLGGTVEQAAGYRDGRYIGDNLHALMCYTYNYRNHINVRFVADKDPAEAWGKANYLGYHLMLSDIGALERLVVGRFNLQFGQGLTLWTGLRPFGILGQSPVRYGSGVRQASAFYEEDYQEGIAATVNVGAGIRLSAFASHAQGETLLGGHAEYRRGNLMVGFTGTWTALDSLSAVRDYVYNANAFRGSSLANFGIDALYRYRRLLFYGEAAMSSECRPAAIAGIMVNAVGSTNFGVSYRYYDNLYHNLHAQGYAMGSTMAEKGVSVDMQTVLPLAVSALLSVDVHSFPSLRYGAYSPSSGSWLRVKLARHFGRGVEATVRYAYRQKERNIPNVDSTLYIGERTLHQQAQAELTASAGDWRFGTRAVYARFDSRAADPQDGWLVAQTVRYSHGAVQSTVGLAWFDVDGYYARIYLSEANLQYNWSMPMLNGRGLRASAVLRYDLCRWLTVAAKYAIVYYPGMETVGSGAAQTEGPCRQTWFMQLRCKF